MADEPKRTGEEVLAANPKLAEMLAEKIPGIVGESMQAQFAEHINPQIAEMLKAARADVERKHSPTEQPQGEAQMTDEQGAEMLRCSVLTMAYGRPVQPRAELDVGGVITQGLTSIEGDAGGYTLPEGFVAELNRRADVVTAVWPLLNKRTTRSRKVVKPELTDYPVPSRGTAANVNSATTATEITESNVTFGELEWDLEDFDMRYPIKLDLLEESPLDLYQELIDVGADAYARVREAMPLTGRGHATHKEPVGLLDAAAGIAEVAINAAPTVDNLLDFFRRLPQEYRSRATAVLPSATFFKVASVLAKNVNAPQFLTQLRVLPTMQESPYVTEGKIVYGDFNRYVVYSIRLMQIITSVAAERKTREVVITETWTGRPTIKDAFRIGTGVTY